MTSSDADGADSQALGNSQSRLRRRAFNLWSVSAPQAADYRRDINALRGIAIAAVVLYHAFPCVLPGGFIGVDVFFVISGYLITGIIASQMDANAFSLVTFYSRRINRIFPALVVVLVSCAGLGMWLLLSREFATLGAQTVAAATFTSNFALLNDAGYFDEASHTKPLLHLWSLAIEEQFYVGWPVALLLANWLRYPLVRLAGGLTFCSFVGCIWWTRLEHDAAFYLPITRGWELLSGGVLALAERDKRLSSLAALPALRWIGVVAIGAALFLLNPRSTFPGFWALLPVVGTAVVIGVGSASPVNAALGSVHWLGRLGSISYPLYLWHWPLLSFARILSGRPLTINERVALVAVAVVLAWLTLRLLEAPLRRGRQSPAKTLVLTAALLAIGVGGYGIFALDGFPMRSWIIPSDAKARELGSSSGSELKIFPCTDRFLTSPPTLRYCKRSKASEPEFAVFGDSHADQLFYGLARNDPSDTWLLIGHNATPPLSGVETIASGTDTGSQARTAKAIAYLARTPSIKTVVVSFFVDAYLLDEPLSADIGPSVPPPEMSSSLWPGAQKSELIRHGLELTVKTLETSGKRVVLVLDLPELPFLPQDCIRRPASQFFSRPCELPRSMVDSRQTHSRAMLRQIAADLPGTLLFDQTSQLCDRSVCRFETGDTMLYHDSNHLTGTGSDLMGRAMLQFLKKAPKATSDDISHRSTLDKSSS